MGNWHGEHLRGTPPRMDRLRRRDRAPADRPRARVGDPQRPQLAGVQPERGRLRGHDPGHPDLPLVRGDGRRDRGAAAPESDRLDAARDLLRLGPRHGVDRLRRLRAQAAPGGPARGRGRRIGQHVGVGAAGRADRRVPSPRLSGRASAEPAVEAGGVDLRPRGRPRHRRRRADARAHDERRVPAPPQPVRRRRARARAARPRGHGRDDPGRHRRRRGEPRRAVPARRDRRAAPDQVAGGGGWILRRPLRRRPVLVRALRALRRAGSELVQRSRVCGS